jgi:mono/diheme cytochrome c family protein
LYGDYSTGRIWAVKHDGQKVEWHKEIAVTSLKITGFSTDPAGELLICDHAGPGQGGFYTLEPNPAPKTSGFPKKLSESGLFDSVKAHRMKAGVMPYSVNAPFWSDGMHKERFIALPDGETIGYTHNRGWNFPDKTVIVKSFAAEGVEGDAATRKWIETRFLTKQGGEWFGYSYVWDAAGADATLVASSGMDREIVTRARDGSERKQVWHYPSRAECMVCHSRAQGFVLGLCELQMNKDHDYGGGRVENQLRVLERLGMLKGEWLGEVRGAVNTAAEAKGLKGPAADEYVKIHLPQPGQREARASSLLARPPAQLKRLVDPYDKAQDLALRARSWLHANCSSCHVEAGGGNAQMDLEFGTALEKMRLVDVKPLHQTFDLPDARLLAPGAPERSVLLHRMGTRGAGQMPPLASNRVDTAGLELMREWCRTIKKPGL